MLTHLHIENYAIIEHLDIDFYVGLNTITGETGAGKSILLGALGLLSGSKAEATVIGALGDQLIVEGDFDISGYGMEQFFEERDLDYSAQITIRRIVSRSGKNRAFVDSQPVTLAVLKDLMGRLVDIHSQHETLFIVRSDFQREIVDAVGGNEELLNLFWNSYRSYMDSKAELDRLTQASKKSKEKGEYLEYHINRIEDLKLKAGECAELEEEQSLLANAEEIGSELAFSLDTLQQEQTGALIHLKAIHSALARAARKFSGAEQLDERVNSVYIELRDIAMELGRMVDDVVVNPVRLEFLNARLDAIYSECKKHDVQTGEELLGVLDKLKTEYSDIEGLDMAIQEGAKRVERYGKEALSVAEKLSAARAKVVGRIEKYVLAHLVQLGMKSPQFKVELARLDQLSEHGIDSVRFLFAGGGGQQLLPLEKVASGGEMSRLMLTLKGLVAQSIKLPTIIFDEIDTGVSGAVADAMGVIIEGMGCSMQVINITHLAQVASKGEYHFQVYKDRGTHIRLLSQEERMEQIAAMLSGAEITDAARAQAATLLNKNRNN